MVMRTAEEYERDLARLRDKVRSVKCPSCMAPAGKPCISLAVDPLRTYIPEPLDYLHSSRYRATPPFDLYADDPSSTPE